MGKRTNNWGMIAIAFLLAASLFGSGCSQFSEWRKTETVSDPNNNLFHVDVPESWQVTTENGFISMYADKQLPPPHQLPSALSLLAFTSRETTDASPVKMLDYLVNARAKSRGWKNISRSKVKQGDIGDRPASYIDVSAIGADGKRFDSRFYFVRTGGTDTFVAVIAPTGKRVTEFDKVLGEVSSHWYWHVEAAATASADTTGEQ